MDLVTIVNLLLCLIIMAIGVLGYSRSKHKLPLILGIVFGLFAVSHFLVLLGVAGELGPTVFAIRVLAYGMVVFLLYRYVQKLDIF